jgi:hypothetical protein
MAHFDNRTAVDAIIAEAFSNGGDELREVSPVPSDMLGTFIETFFRHAAGSIHGRDLILSLAARCHEDARAEGLARLQLTAAGLSTAEIDSAIEDFPELLDRWRRPTREELEQAGPI